MIRVKRVYEEADKSDGFRILVDRLWPRGLTKEKVHVDLWMKDIAPSDSLRKWFNHDPAEWQEFKKRYIIELKNKDSLIKILHDKVRDGLVTLIYAAKDAKHNNVVVLKEYLER